MKPIRLVCIVEVADVVTVEEAVATLDAFRRAAGAWGEGLTITKATPEDVAKVMGRRGGKVTGGVKQEAAQRNGMGGGRPPEHGRRRGKLRKGCLVYWRDPQGRRSGWGRIMDKRFDGTFVVTLRDSGDTVKTVEHALRARVQRRVLGPGTGAVMVRKRRKDRKPRKGDPKS